MWLKIAIVFALLVLSRVAAGSEGPWPPCAGAPRPAYAHVGEPPQVQVWRGADVGDGWHPPDCAEWISLKPGMLVALAGRFPSDGSLDSLLARFGAVSALLHVRYWSVTDGKWERLIASANALDGPDLKRQRSDFTVEELKSGRYLYFAQEDNRSSGPVIYRLRVHGVTTDRFTVEIENITPVRFYLVQLYAAGSLRSLYFLDRGARGGWDYYSLMEVSSDASSLTQGNERSYVNRTVALFRHIAGIPTDQDPPAAR